MKISIVLQYSTGTWQICVRTAVAEFDFSTVMYVTYCNLVRNLVRSEYKPAACLQIYPFSTFLPGQAVEGRVTGAQLRITFLRRRGALRVWVLGKSSRRCRL